MSGLIALSGGTFKIDATGQLLPGTLRPLRDPATIHRDFEQDVLERLLKLKANALGVPVVGVKAALNGEMKIMCAGLGYDGRYRKFTLRFSTAYLADRHYLGDPVAVSEVAYQLLCSTTEDKLPPAAAPAA